MLFKRNARIYYNYKGSNCLSQAYINVHSQLSHKHSSLLLYNTLTSTRNAIYPDKAPKGVNALNDVLRATFENALAYRTTV